MASVVNVLMSRVGIRLKRDRVRFWDEQDYWIRKSVRRGVKEAALFFRTGGCRHDHAGGCTMCDYSAGPPTDASTMVDIVRRALEELPADTEHLLFSPSGSFLDAWEVPLEARRGILERIAATDFPWLSFETRAETLTKRSIEDCRNFLAERNLKIYVGLESADPWVSKFAINKHLWLDDFRRGAALLTQNSIRSSANVLLGAPFLTEGEAIDDTVRTARWAFEVAGVGECCIFPTHVKRWTQVQWLYENTLYRPPSLWSLIEVISRLGRQFPAERIEIAWYRSHDAFNILASPTTCHECHDDVLEGLDRFTEEGDLSAVEALVRFACPCRSEWARSLAARPIESRLRQTEEAYERMARALLPEGWWEAHGRAIQDDLLVVPASGPADNVSRAQ